MKITFDKIFETDLSGVQLFVLYGNAESVIERAIDFIRYSHPNFKSEILDSPDQGGSSEPSLFESEPQLQMNILKTSSEKIIKSIDLSSKTKWIILASSLRSKSPVVMDSQQQSHILTCSCYEAPLIPKELVYYSKKYNIDLTQDQLRVLHQQFLTNVEGLKDLLSVLSYCSPLHDSEFQDFCKQYNVLNNVSPLNTALLIKDRAAFLKSCESELESETMIPTLRSFSRTFEILLAKKAGVQPLPYTVFFKDEPFYEKGLKLWSERKAQDLLKVLLFLEHDVKFKAIGPEIIIERIQPFLLPEKH